MTVTFLPELTTEEMLQLLTEERVGRLGLNDRPQPYVVPTDFTFLDGAIYIHTPASGRKARLARLDPDVCFEVDRFNPAVTDFRSVLVRGRIAEVSDPGEKAKVMRSMGEKAADFDFAAAHGRQRDGGSRHITIFRIDVREMTGVRSPGNGH